MKRCLILLFLIVTIISCKDNTSVPFGSVEGFVLDSKTGKPLASVQIITDPPSASVVTTSNGYFQIDNLVNGDYSFAAIRDGYFDATVKAKIYAEKTTKIEILMFTKSGTDTNNPQDSTHNGSTTPNAMDSEIIKSLKSSLVAYYPFNGDANDYSGNNLNGKSFNCMYTTDNKNQSNRAVKLNSSNSSNIVVDNPYSFNLKQFTYSFWVRTRNNPGIGYDDHIDVISRWGSWGSGNSSITYCVGSQNNLKFIYYNSGYGTSNGDSRNYSFINTNYILEPETWTHVCYTCSNNQTKLYINGQYVNSFATITPQDSYTYGIMIGSRFDSIHIAYFNGDVDELFIFSKELADSEINKIYQLNK